jgi:hypothetical protein
MPKLAGSPAPYCKKQPHMTADITKYPSYSYGKYLSELLKFAKKHKIQNEIIGWEKFEKTGMKEPLYRLTINPKAKINFCVVAGIHGEEIAGPFSILHALKNPKKYFNKNIRYRIYPVINPTGFDLKQRYDDDNSQLNTINKRVLKSKKFGEIKIFLNDIKKLKFEVFLSLHEEITNKEFYAFVFESRPTDIYKKMTDKDKKYAKIFKSKTIGRLKTDEDGLIINEHDQSFEDYLFTHKRAKISLCTETPGKIPLEKRIKNKSSEYKNTFRIRVKAKLTNSPMGEFLL